MTWTHIWRLEVMRRNIYFDKSGKAKNSHHHQCIYKHKYAFCFYLKPLKKTLIHFTINTSSSLQCYFNLLLNIPSTPPWNTAKSPTSATRTTSSSSTRRRPSNATAARRLASARATSAAAAPATSTCTHIAPSRRHPSPTLSTPSAPSSSWAGRRDRWRVTATRAKRMWPGSCTTAGRAASTSTPAAPSYPWWSMTAKPSCICTRKLAPLVTGTLSHFPLALVKLELFPILARRKISFLLTVK